MAVFFAVLLLMHVKEKYLTENIERFRGNGGLMMYLIGTMTSQGNDISLKL
jgi:hypothetical protein